MIVAVLLALGFLTGLFLYLVLPEMDVLRKRWYSRNVSPLIEEFLKFLPWFFGYNPVLFAAGFAVFEVVEKRRERKVYLLSLFVFHVSSTAVATCCWPFGFAAAVVVHYFVNRRADLWDLVWVASVLFLLGLKCMV